MVAPSCSPPVTGLAYVSIAYTLACVLYLVLVRWTNVGTPFHDSLWPEQIAIKKQSARKRAVIFWTSVALAVALLAVLRPLRALGR